MQKEVVMADKRKGKGVLVKVNDLSEDELDATLTKALDILFGDAEDEPIMPAKTKAVFPSSHKRKTPKGSRKKSKDN